MTGLLTQAQHGFEAVFGYSPDGIWSAPGRVNLIGEHTDYNEGFVLPFAIDRRTFAALALRSDGLVRVSSSLADGTRVAGLRDLSPSAGHGWAAYPLGVAWALGQLGAGLAGLPGFDVHFTSDVPPGAGLASSAALEAALAVALNEAWGLDFSRARLVNAAHLAENEFVGAPTGILDQSAALLSAEGAALLIDCRDCTSLTVDLRLDEHGLAVLVIDTKVRHEHATGGYAARRASCEKAARALGVRTLRDVSLQRLAGARSLLDAETYRRARHVITENKRVLDTVQALGCGDHVAAGRLMTASHCSMRDDFEISTPELDLAVDAAMAGGAIGARMTGGGFGGSAIALATARTLPRLQAAISRAFTEQGPKAPQMFAVRPSRGARRDK